MKNGISVCLQGKLWTILMDCLISMNVPMERGGIVAFLLRTMNIFWELLKIQKNENGKII